MKEPEVEGQHIPIGRPAEEEVIIGLGVASRKTKRAGHHGWNDPEGRRQAARLNHEDDWDDDEIQEVDNIVHSSAIDARGMGRDTHSTSDGTVHGIDRQGNEQVDGGVTEISLEERQECEHSENRPACREHMHRVGEQASARILGRRGLAEGGLLDGVHGDPGWRLRGRPIRDRAGTIPEDAANPSSILPTPVEKPGGGEKPVAWPATTRVVSQQIAADSAAEWGAWRRQDTLRGRV